MLLVLPVEGHVGEPVALSGTGIATWEVFGEARSIDEAVAALALVFSAQASEIVNDVEQVVAMLTAIGALQECTST
jgi:hypothetical protein